MSSGARSLTGLPVSSSTETNSDLSSALAGRRATDRRRQQRPRPRPAEQQRTRSQALDEASGHPGASAAQYTPGQRVVGIERQRRGRVRARVGEAPDLQLAVARGATASRVPRIEAHRFRELARRLVERAQHEQVEPVLLPRGGASRDASRRRDGRSGSATSGARTSRRQPPEPQPRPRRLRCARD